MHLGGHTMKYVCFAAIVLLPQLTRSLFEQKCEHFRSLNSTEQEPPVLQITKTTYELWYTGKFGSLHCCVSGNPLPRISWFKGGYRLDLSNSKLRPMDNNQSLWIGSLRRSDSGRYTCQASNAKGNVSRSFDVEVKSTLLYQVPVVILKPHSWKTVIGNNVTFNCVILKSARKPKLVYWLYQRNITGSPKLIRKSARQTITLNKTEKEQSWSSKLIIKNVTMDDEGRYICMVRNGLKPANDTGVLTIEEDMSLDGGIETAKPEKPEKPEKSKLATIAVVGAVLLTIVIIAFFVWRHKRRSGSPGYVLHDKDKRLDSGPENNCLISNGAPLHFEIPRENLQLLRHGADDPADLDYDVFLSYSSQDRDFVKNVLYSELVTTHSVCIDFKDFEAGLYIGDNILNSIFKSRKTLLVVTQNFLNGEWTYFEMQIAQGRLAQGHDVLIPVIVDDIPYDELPRALQLYRQTKTYLEYFNEDVKPHFWDRLRSALGPSLDEMQDTPVTTPESPEENDLVNGHFV